MKSIFNLLLVLSVFNLSAQTLVVNPYKNVNWKNQYKANYHTHTNNSDGGYNAEYVVDTYAKNGYDILVLTDHNLVTYPWTNFSSLNEKWSNRDPEKMKILTFPGNELSRGGHDRNMFFARIPGGGDDIDLAFKTMQDSLALGIFNHPGRYWKFDKNYSSDEKYSPDWYVDYFKKYNSVIGIEVYNTPYDRYPYDRILWDEILIKSMPETPVWGYSNDDMHGDKELMGNYNTMLMSEKSVPALKNSMKNGAFYISHEPGKSGKALAPKIKGIVVDEKKKMISVISENYDEIEWISGVKGEGTARTNNIIGKDRAFNYKGFKGNYVRFQLKNKNGITLSQPFGFK